jgi:hypothetical protein
MCLVLQCTGQNQPLCGFDLGAFDGATGQKSETQKPWVEWFYSVFGIQLLRRSLVRRVSGGSDLFFARVWLRA